MSQLPKTSVQEMASLKEWQNWRASLSQFGSRSFDSNVHF
jgi:hypothetical protein